jgi:hypothetical protein
LVSNASAALHGHYPFDDGGPNDVSGNDYHGTLVGTAEVIADPCGEMTGMVLNLSGDPDYVLLPTALALPSGDQKTVCMFINVRDFTSWARIYYAYDYPKGQVVALGNSGRVGGTLSRNDDGGPMTSSGVITEGQWHHVCLIGGGSETEIYFDGVLAFAVSEGWSFIAEAAALGCRYGGGGPSNSNFFNGMIDDVRVYDEAIDVAYIDRIINGEFESAWNPNPEDDATDLNVSLAVSWSAGESADSHDVYFGTDGGAVASADHNDAEYMGNQADTSYNPGTLDRSTEYFWRIDECNTVSGLVEGPVWSFTTTNGKAINPYPATGEEATQPLILTWGTCAGVLSHDVYIGRYSQSVAVANTADEEYQGNVDVNSFNCGTLNIGSTYYWRVDEHYAGDVIVAGDVWEFTLLDRMPIEDFERYTSDANLRENWGGHYPESAAYIYLEEWDGADDTDQSMEIWYANQYSPYFSEGYLTGLGHYESTWDPWTQTGEIIYVPLDMTAGRGGAIDLYWHGQAGNDNGVMYVALEDADGNNVASTYEPNDMTVEDWQVWRIELSDFSDQGLDLTEVETIYVGVGDRYSPAYEDVEGHLWIDEIALFPPRCLPEYAVPGDITGDCKVNEKDLVIMTQDWLDSDFYEYIPVSEPCEANLICLYTFETADGTDSSGNDLHALRGGNAHVADPGDPDRGTWALETLTDWVDYLYVPHDPLFQLSEQITMAGWIKPNTVSGWRTIFGKFGNYKSMYLVQVGSLLACTLRPATSNNWVAMGPGSLEQDVWQHIAVTNDGTTVTGWLNGEIKESAATLGTMDNLATDTGDLWIASNEPWHETFLGQMDDLCIYDYGLDVAEILSAAGYVGAKETYLPLDSDAEIYSEEPQGGRAIDQNDLAVLAVDWGVNAGFGGEVEDLPPPPEILPYAWWHFEDQNAADYSGNDFHGTLVGGAAIVNDLERGWVLDCESSDSSFVQLPLGILLPDGTAKSVSFWLKPESSQSWRGILSARNTSSNQLRIGIADSGPRSITASLNVSQYFCFRDSWEIDEWYHIAVTSTGVGDQTLYANGVVKTEGWADYISAWADEAVMGHRAGGSSYYDGRLDDVRIYDWQLTVPEVMAILNEAPPVHARGTWNFDDDTANDSSGNDLTSTLVPTASIVEDADKGKVLELGGGYIVVDHNEPLTITDEITLMAWVKPNSRWWHTIISNDTLKSIYWFLSNGQMGINFNPPRSWSNWMTGLNITMDGNTWTHVAITYDGSTIRAYQNIDEGYAETACTGSLNINQGNAMYIGATLTSWWGEWFYGRLDDVRVYHWALSEDELQEIYDETAP